MQGIHLRKYGVEAKIPFVLYEVDGVDLRVDASDGGTDCALTKDEGAETTCDNDLVDEGSGYSITLTATEMEAARISVYIIDSATKVWLDEVLIIETYGNASAQHAFDLDTASVAQGADNDTLLTAIAGYLDTEIAAIVAAVITNAAGTDVAADIIALKAVVGGLADAAAAGEVTEADTLMQYIKQLLNVLIGAAGIGAWPSAAAPANTVSIAEALRAVYDDTNAIQGKLPTNKFMGSSDGADDDGTLNTIAGDVANIDGDAMRGTNSANTTTPPTVGEIQAEMEENGASILDTIRDKMPTNYCMGSSDQADHDGDFETIVDNPWPIPDVPAVMEKPEAGSELYPIYISFHNEPDAAPTLAAANSAGTSRDLNLSATTMVKIADMYYKVTYEVDTSHVIEGLNFIINYVEGGVTRRVIRSSMVRDDQSTKIDAVHAALITSSAELAGIPAANASLQDKIELLFMALKNKFTSTASQQDIHDDAESSIGSASLSDDATTLTKGEFS